MYTDRDGRKFQVVDLQSTPHRQLSCSTLTDKDACATTIATTFAESYLSAIEKTAQEHESCIILVAAQAEIRHAMADKALRYMYLYPNPSIKQQWLARMEKRKPGDRIMDAVDKNWKDWVEGEEKGHGFEERRNIETREISEDQGLADVIDDIIEHWDKTMSTATARKENRDELSS